MPHAFDLTGRRVLVTGAAGGIGAATARACATLGAALILTDVRADMPVADELRSGGHAVTTTVVDMRDRTGIEAMVRGAGPLDAVVANAGFVAWDDWDDEGWDDTFQTVVDINLRGTINLVRACLPAMRARRSGRIVIVTSVAGKVGGVRSGPHYVAAKGGLNAFVKWAARKAAPDNVLVNGVAPGPTASPMTASQSFDVSGIPLGRMASVEEIAWPITFLCSSAADYVCGSVLDVNGGIYMN